MPIPPFVCGSSWLATTLTPEGVITALAPGVEQFTGYSSQELIGCPVTRILDDSSALELPHILDTANEWGHWEGEVVHRTRSGKAFEAQGMLTVLAGAGSCLGGYLLFSSLRAGSIPGEPGNPVLSEVGQRLRTFAHDLNNPLAVMMGFTQLLILNASCVGSVRDDVERLQSELKRMVDVVEKLHRYAMSLHEKQRAVVHR